MKIMWRLGGKWLFCPIGEIALCAITAALLSDVEKQIDDSDKVAALELGKGGP